MAVDKLTCCAAGARTAGTWDPATPRTAIPAPVGSRPASSPLLSTCRCLPMRCLELQQTRCALTLSQERIPPVEQQAARSTLPQPHPVLRCLLYANQDAERPQSSLPILPLFAAEHPCTNNSSKAAAAMPDSGKGGRDGGLPYFRLDGGLTAPHLTPEEISARTGHDMGALWAPCCHTISRQCSTTDQPASAFLCHARGIAEASCSSSCRVRCDRRCMSPAATGSPEGDSQYMESRPSAAALSPQERASPKRLQAMADIAGRTLQHGAAARRLHLVPGAGSTLLTLQISSFDGPTGWRDEIESGKQGQANGRHMRGVEGW